MLSQNNDCFDCLNANRFHTQYRINSVYCTPLDWRLHWLQSNFLKYFQDWKDWAMSQEDVPLSERKQYFLVIRHGRAYNFVSNLL